MSTPLSQPSVSERQQWMKILASADSETLLQLWQQQNQSVQYTFIRQPETGLSMIRGRIGNSGQPFNLGEMTLTRCAVQLNSGTLGVSYVMGRNHQHAETAAVIDALLQEAEQNHSQLYEAIVTPLAEAKARIDKQTAAEVRSTQVDFFTLVRGED